MIDLTPKKYARLSCRITRETRRPQYDGSHDIDQDSLWVDATDSTLRIFGSEFMSKSDSSLVLTHAEAALLELSIRAILDAVKVGPDEG